MRSQRFPRVSVARGLLALAVSAFVGCAHQGAVRTAWQMPSDDWPAVATTSAPIATSPLSLTASDGTGLSLVSLDARAVVGDPLAFTELALTFENPGDRVLEGTFRITLPEHASVSRFAMKIGDEWQEGEVVELQAARRAYEDFLHRKQDPALLEQAAGNEFSARVFPIPAHGKKEIVVSYAQEITGGTYALPLKGLPEIASARVSASEAGSKDAPKPLELAHVAPAADYSFRTKRASGSPSVRAGNLVAAAVRPHLPASADPVTSAIVLVDTSASRALGFDGELSTVQQIVMGWAPRHVALTVASFDQSVNVAFEGDAATMRPADLAKLHDHGALGASDLEGALRFARERAAKTHAKRVVLITDGVATLGASEPAKLKEASLALRAAGIERVDAIAVGGIRDQAALTQIVRAGLAHDGIVADGSADAGLLAKRLDLSTRSGLDVSVEGATWSWPRKLDGVQEGDVCVVYAEVPEGRPVRVKVGDAAAALLDPLPGDRPLLERAVAQARISSLFERKATEPKNARGIDRDIVALSVKHRVLTSLTGMLVLETEDDYARFGIDHRALADILVLRDGHVSRSQRAFRAHDQQAQAQSAPVEDARRKVDSTTDQGPPPADAPGAQPTTSVAAQSPAPKAAVSPPTAGGAPDMRPAPPPPAASPPPPAPIMADAPREASVSRARPSRSESDHEDVAPASDTPPEPTRVHPYTGRFGTIMAMLARGDVSGALGRAKEWRHDDPSDVLALLALGEAFEKAEMVDLAARAYGSIIDLFSSRADLRRLAGERLERLAGGAGLDIAIDTYTKAVESRPDHPSSHRLLAYALLKRGAFARAFEAVKKGSQQQYPSGRFLGVDRILREDLGLVAAAWTKADPAHKAEIAEKLRAAGGTIEDGPSLRFVLNWETDANDVDFHIHDGEGGHAFYGAPSLRSGGELYADVTTGYGPECFTIRGKRRATPYVLEAHYYSRGPMGYGMGKLEIVEHDGRGGLRFEERPFVVMVDQAFVDLGTVE
jgi:Vault protein inter-alpha-trypsin domain/von Willebrand factor type A domain